MTRIVDKFSGGATIYDNGVSLLSDRGGIKVERDGKLYVTHDGGSSWRQCCPIAGSNTETIQRNIWFKHMNFEQDDLLINGKTVWETLVYKTSSRTGERTGFFEGGMIHSDGKGHVLTMTNLKTWYSSDHGETFKLMENNPEKMDMLKTSTGSKYMCVANNNNGRWIFSGYGGLFISENDGETWTLLKSKSEMDHGQGWIDCNPASADGNNYDTWITENYRCTNDIRVDRNWKRLSEPTGPIFLGHNNKGQHFWLNSLLNNNQMSKDNGLSWTLSIPTHHDFEAVTGNVPSDMIHGTDRNGRVLGFKKMEARTYTTTGKTTLGGLMVSSDFGENWKFYPGTSGFEGYFPNKGEGLVTDYKGFYYYFAKGFNAFSTKNGLLFKEAASSSNIYNSLMDVFEKSETHASKTSYRKWIYDACWTGKRFIFLGANGHISKSEMLTDEELALPFVPPTDIDPPNP